MASFDATAERLVNGDSMFKNTIITEFSNEVPELINATSMFEGTKLTGFNVSTPRLTWANGMFAGCTAMESVSISSELLETANNLCTGNTSIVDAILEAPNLKSAVSAFEGCTEMENFSGNLQSLENGKAMFKGCPLIDFNSKLSSLTNGNEMFLNNKIVKWQTGLPKLVDGTAMFSNTTEEDGKLTSFEGNLNALQLGTNMFSGQPLTYFASGLPSLTDGVGMFSGAQLDANSCMYVIESISLSGGEITIGIDCYDNDTARDNYATSTGFYTSFEDMTTSLTSRGWNPTWEYNISASNELMKYTLYTNLSDLSADYPNYIEDINADGGWDYYLNSLTNAANGTTGMFQGSDIITFDMSLPALTSAEYMFGSCNSLTTFNSDLSSLTNAYYMFKQCERLTSFSADLSNLTYGNTMFADCYALESFNGDLSSLTNGLGMFAGTKLDAASVKQIGNTIKDVRGLTNSADPSVPGSVYKTIHIGINCADNELARSGFGNEAGLGSWFALEGLLTNKGWTVEWGFNKVTSVDLSKYSTCTNKAEMEAINPNYKNDLIDGAWKYDLSSFATDGYAQQLFKGSTMTSCDLYMPLVTDGVCNICIDCPNLTTAKLNAPEATDSGYSFANCSNLTSAKVYVPKSACTSWMFENCTKLTSFAGNLSSVEQAMGMFTGCKLDVASVKNIAETLGDFTSDTDTHTITIGIDANYKGNSELNDTLNAIAAKGWTVEQEYNGTATSVDTNLLKYNTFTTKEALATAYPNYASDLVAGTWIWKLDNLTDPTEFFGNSGSTEIIAFDADLPNAVNASSMFYKCYNLRSFKGDLSKVTNGSWLF